MPIINIFTKQSPSWNIGGQTITFDAVFEDTLSASVEYLGYPIEIGAEAADHAVILPSQYRIIAGVSNNPLSTSLADIGLGAISDEIDSGIFNTVAPFLASFLSGSNATRAGDTLQLLFNIMYSRTPFDLDAGDYQLSNMVITGIERTKTAQTEGGLEFVADLQELPLLDTVITRNQPTQDILLEGSVEQTQAAAEIARGEVGALSVPANLDVTAI